MTTDEELQGFLIWALRGLDRILSSGKITYPISVSDRSIIYEMLSNPYLAFIEDCVTITGRQTDIIPKHILYQAYLDFCKRKQFAPVLDSSFAKNLKREIPSIGQSHPYWRNRNELNSRYQSVWVIDYLNLKFVCNLRFEI